MSKETINEYLNIVNAKLWNDSAKMQQYIKSICSDVLKTGAGNYVLFEKPHIETNFCFGHGQNGITTEEETESACNAAAHARKSEQYFLNKNLENINQKIKTYTEAHELYLLPQYQKIDNIGHVVTENYFRHYPHEEKNILEKLTDSDRQNLIQICESEKAKFLKRLNTYLKRYGLTKIHAWSYLVD